ncbi:hypothetical protein BKA58DRAFT_230776 [Alternaria rosae]|uniref:uncharacterized protein n=1 Tax=Alternaria rosae TaxID=1187941 RepID=UPI001E8E86D7|nr:uncharacterized protein BKA58DRAFT_230776 [Alternaria rosae]KAH6865992.1 hypothetical protein BKA58DRAFT_230776 [Alternaria rosae]
MSSGTPKEAPAIAKDTEMARLSVSANATPKTDRKPSRFRGLFRQQSSSNASSSPATLQKSPPPVASSPLASPYVRPGYEQIGLLPSEQSVHSLQELGETESGDDETIGSTAVAKSYLGAKDNTPIRDAGRGSSSNSVRRSHAGLLSESQIERLLKKPPSFPHSAHSASPKRHVGGTDRNCVGSEVAKSQDMSPRAAGNADKQSGLLLGSSHKIAETMNNENSSHISDASITDSATCETLPNIPSYPQHGGPVEDPSLEHYKTTSITRTNDFLKTARISPRIPRSFETADEHDHKTLLDEDEPSPRKSFASNIFDDSSPSQGIREYVTSKIAEALAEHNRECQDGNATVSNVNPSNLIVKIDTTGLARATTSEGLTMDERKIGDFPERFTIGPFEVGNARLERDAQFSIMAIHAVTLLCASLRGPKSLLLALWNMAIILGIYAAVLRQLRWTEDFERDVLLAPVCFAASVIASVCEQLLGQMRMMMVEVLAEALERVARGCDMQVHTE